MLRISQSELADKAITLHVEGRIVGEWVAELERACFEILRGGRKLTLNLAEVEYIDRTGLALLKALFAQGVALSACSPFLQQQLKSFSA